MKRMNKIKSIRELELVKQKLKYREMYVEKELIGSSTDLINHFTDKLKDFTFDFGLRMVTSLFQKKAKRNKN